MPVPEAAVYENDLPPGSEYDVRRTWKIANMKPVAVSQLMEKTTHDHLRLSVLLSDSRHAAIDGIRIHSGLETRSFETSSHPKCIRSVS